MTRLEALRALMQQVDDEPVVFTTGFTCRDAHAIRDRRQNFYMTGSMGLAAPIGVGLAHRTSRLVVVVDGDGAVLMNPGALLLVGSSGLRNLLHIVIDNGCYESTGGQRTDFDRFPLHQLAAAAGYRFCARPGTLDEYRQLLHDATRGRVQGPTLAHVCVTPQKGPPGPRVSVGLQQVAARFRDSMRLQPSDRAPTRGPSPITTERELI